MAGRQPAAAIHNLAAVVLSSGESPSPGRQFVVAGLLLSGAETPTANKDEEKTLFIDVDAWNGLGDRVLNTMTKGREVVVNGRLALSTYTKEEDGVKMQVTKPVIKLTSFHLCGRKPTAESEAQPGES
ncbi:MAG TPA: single-stranded DNA-binding protein [Alphaproteobacteria bacterium]|nr:single-stranded DNA-binding protein [Alphaproteobacteria bacterium]